MHFVYDIILFRVDELDMTNKHIVFLMFSMISWWYCDLFITYVSALNMIWWHGVRWMSGDMLGRYDMYDRSMLGDAMIDVC